ALKDITGDFNKALKEASNILGIKGEVLPVSLKNTRLYARLENNLLIKGESNIDHPQHDGTLSIKKVFLKPLVLANPEALQAIKKADFIIIGPGDLYTSIIPNFLVKGIKAAVKKSKAKKIYICNIMTKFGETNNYTAEKFLSVLEKYLGPHAIDYFIVNTEKPKQFYLEKYKKEGAALVKYNKKYLESLKKPKVIFARLVRNGPLLRHDPKDLARVITKLIAS
ncbi:MAG: YvcK family protein, partial [Parcubacteria group bacterium]|nr:YvcK family protein [Parcubacteria group bacterium]